VQLGSLAEQQEESVDRPAVRRERDAFKPLEVALLLELGERGLPFFHEVLPRLVFLARDRAIPTDVQHRCGHGSVLLVCPTSGERKGNAETTARYGNRQEVMTSPLFDIVQLPHIALPEMHAHVGVPPQPAGSVWHA